MISAGEQVKWTKDQQRDFICGQHFVKAQEETANSETASADAKEMAQAQAEWLEVNAADSTCQAKFEEIWDKYTEGLNDAQYLFFESEAGYYGAFGIYQRCQNRDQFTFDKSLESASALAHCTSYYLNPDQLPFNKTFDELEGEPTLNLPEVSTALSYHGKDMAGYEEVLAHIKLAATGMIDKAGITSEGIEMPQSLKDFIEELKKAGLPEHAQLAHDLFYQGVGLTKPSGEMALAAQPIADDVKEYVRKKAGKPLTDYVMADDADKPGIATKNDAKDFPEIEYVFVSKTGPKPDYEVDIKEAPKAIKDYFKDFPPPIRREALRLYGEALEKAGKGAKDEDVAKLLVDKIKEKDKKHGGDKAKLADELMRLKVHEVEMPNKIIFREIDSPSAPSELYDLVAEGSNVKKWILNDIWSQIRSKLKDQGVEAMDLKLMEKIVDDLAPKLKGKSIKDLAAQKVMAVNKKTGKVTLVELTKEIQDILYHTANTANSNLPPTKAQMGGMVYTRSNKIYYAAKKAKPKMKDEELALKVDEAVNKYLMADKNTWTTDGEKALGKFMFAEFDGFNPDGSIKLKDKDGPVGNADGSWTATTDKGWNLVFNAGVDASAGLVFGVDGKDKDPEAKKGNEIFSGHVLGAMKLGFGKESVGNFTINAGILAFASPPMMTPGIPEQEQNASTALHDGSGQLFRLNHLYPQWDKSWDNDKTDVDLAIKIGFLSARPSDGTGLGMNFVQNPFGSFQPFTQQSSRSVGGAVDLGLGWGEIDTHYNDESYKVKLTPSVLLGTALAAVQADENGGMIDAAGFRIGGSLQADFDASGTTKSTDLQFRLLGVGFQHSSGKYEGVEDALSGYSLLFGGSMMLQPHTHFKAGLGGSYGLKQDELDGKIQRFVIGGYLAAPVPIEDKNITVTPGFGWDVFKVWTDERNVAGGTVDGTDPDCEPGYVCEDDGGTTIGDDSQGGLMSTGDMAMWMAGNTVAEFYPNVNVEFGNTGLYLGAGVNIMYIQNVQTDESDTIVMPRITFGGEW